MPCVVRVLYVIQSRRPGGMEAAIQRTLSIPFRIIYTQQHKMKTIHICE